MSESVFFNPGDSLGNFHGYDDAVKKAQLYREKDPDNKHIIVVHGKNKTSFDIFLTENKKDQPTDDKDATYFVNKKL